MIRQTLSRQGIGYAFRCPAPVAEDVIVEDLHNNRHPHGWTAVVDTGGDGTVVPMQVCRDLALPAVGRRRIRSLDPGSPGRDYSLFWVTIRLDGVQEVVLKVIAVERPTLILGRDFLAQCLFQMDGPTSRWLLG